LFNPAIIKSKNRPKNNFKLVRNNKKTGSSGETSTRKDPSLFKHEAFELPSSTTPARIKGDIPKQPKNRSCKTIPEAILILTLVPIISAILSVRGLSTIVLGF
jgi:hypothetical protein